MNVTKLLLCGVTAALSVSVAAAAPHGFARSSAMPHSSMSRPSISSGNPGRFSSSTGVMGNRNRFNQGITGTNRFSTNRNLSGLNLSGTNHHHHHHHHGGNIVFIGGGFGYPFWYDYYPYPYGYGYYDYGQAYYGNEAGYGGSLVADVQQNLANAGYYHGAIDGVMGPETRRAIRSFERANGLPGDGTINRRLLSTMGIR